MRNIMGRPAAAALTALALSACGGGGGGGGGGGNLSAHAACHVPAGGPLARPPQPSWIPFSTFSTTATQGIQVIPSAALTTPPVFTSTTPIGSEVQLYSLATDSAGRIVDQLPFALIYSAATADSGTQLFKLPLTGSTLPAAVQIGKLDIGNRAICNIMSMPTDLHDPASAFVMLSVLRDDTAKCTDFGAAADYYKVSYNDDAGTAATLSFGTPGALPLYTAQGALAGLVDVDSDGNIDLYKDSSFSSPKVLVANGKSFANVYYDGRTAYILIASNSGTLDRLDGDGTLTPVYQLQGYDFFMFPSADNANLLMFDGTTNITNILRMPLDGSTPPQLLSTLQQGLDAVQPLGSTSQKIVLLLPGPAYNTTSVASLDLAAPSTPKTILTVGPLQGGKGLVTLDFAGLHGSDLYLNLLTSEQTQASREAKVLDADTGRTESSEKDAAFIRAGTDYYTFGYSQSGPIIQPRNLIELTGVDPTTGSFSGATFNNIDLDDCSHAPLNSTSGVPFTMPANASFTFFDNGEQGGSLLTVPASNQEGQQSDAMAYDLRNNLLVRITDTPDSWERVVYY